MPRKAISATLQLLEGNPNNKTKKELRKRIKNEKRLNFGIDKLKPPKWLSAKAKKVFKMIVDMYKDTSFLSNADYVTLCQYCDWYSEYMACNTRLKGHGRTQKGKPTGDMQLKLKISQELLRLGKELGLTPAARASLAIHLNDELSQAQQKQWDKEDDEFDDEKAE